MRFLCACLCARHDSEQSIAIDRWRHQTCAVNMLHQTTAAAQHTTNNHIMPGTMHARPYRKWQSFSPMRTNVPSAAQPHPAARLRHFDAIGVLLVF